MYKAVHQIKIQSEKVYKGVHQNETHFKKVYRITLKSSVMSLLKTVCSYYAVGLGPLALFCGVSVAWLKSVSIGRRSLDLHTLQLLLRLREALRLDQSVESLPLPAALEAQVQTVVEVYLQKLNKQIESKESRIEAIEERRRQHLFGWRACQEQLQTNGYTPAQIKWLRLRQAHLSSKLEDSANMVVVQAQLIGLKAEREALQSSEQAE